MVRAVELPDSRRQTSAVGGMGRNAATVAKKPSNYLRRRRDVMGCTSSTQHLHTPTSTQHKTMTDEAKPNTETEVATEINTNENKEEQSRLNELPPCDIVKNNSDVGTFAEENNTLALIDNIKDEFESKKVAVDVENSNYKGFEPNNSQTEDMFSTLDEVVEKVVELYVVDSHANTNEKEKNLTENTPILTESKFEEDVSEAEERHETSSPSESSSSRATRWEALADIAAELPPSLAVDPLTGQIYVLSK